MFKLSIVTPEKVFYEGEISTLMAPGTEGYIGILSHHAPLISALKPGKIEFKEANGDLQVLAVSNGFIEFSNNTATVLADSVERPTEIDIERAKRAFDRARNLLVPSTANYSEIDLPSVRQALERAANRIKVYESKN